MDEKVVEPVASSHSSVREGGMEELGMPPGNQNKMQQWANRLHSAVGVETIGITRVPEEMRERKVTAGDYLHMFVMWFSINCTANQLTLGILGPVAYSLGFTDSIVCCMFGTMFGATCSGYLSQFGPQSGLRTLVIAKYTMGWWPSKLCVLLNLVIELGYGVIDSLVAGLILSAVNGKGMTVIVGIIVCSLISWVVATFGIRWFHQFESYVWAPTVLTLFILIGVAGPKFDIYTPSVGSGAVLVGHRLSYFFLTASGPLGWTSAAADYYAYYPPQTSKWMVFAMTAGGMIFGKLFIESLGIGLGSSLSTNADLAAAFKSHGVGALIVEAYAPLGNFGKFCAVILAVCVTANNIPGTYAAALNWQMFGRWFAKVPQPIWSTVTVIIYLVCAIGGRNHLFTIFTNFLSIIGYWTVGWVAMTIEEQVIFRRMSGYDWSMWNVKSALPVGYAAFVGFGVGWVGAVMGMYQTYYTGPIAKMVGSGADLGIPLAMSWAAVVYPPLRFLELRFLGR